MTAIKTSYKTILLDEPLLFRRIAIHFGVTSPTGEFAFQYLAEGAANVIWSIVFSAGSNLERYSETLVLRLRKDLPITIPSARSLRDFEDQVAPLFGFDPSILLPPRLLEMSPTSVIYLNEELHRLESENKRYEKRRGNYHLPYENVEGKEGEKYGMLMTNLYYKQTVGIQSTPSEMSKTRMRVVRIVEFKPKWLSQSPSAPASAQRCRTCAVNAMRRHMGVSVGRGDLGFCPFDVLSSDYGILSRALSKIWNDEDDDGTDLDSGRDTSWRSALPAFVNAFRRRVQPVLREIQNLQRLHKRVGLKDFEIGQGEDDNISAVEGDGEAESVTRDLAIAMALRDCSIFLKNVVIGADVVDGAQSQQHLSSLHGNVQNDVPAQVKIETIKVLDLDLKHAKKRTLIKWANTERDMIEGDWYLAQRDHGRNDSGKSEEVVAGPPCAMAFQ